MINRRRSRTEPTEPIAQDSSARLVSKCAHWNWDPFYQAWYEGSITDIAYESSGDQMGYSTDGPFGNESQIDDESTAGYAIKDVDHIQKRLPRWPRLSFVHPNKYAHWKTSYYGDWHHSPTDYYTGSCMPWTQLLTALHQKGMLNLKTETANANQAGTLEDKLADLPSRVMRKIEKLHAANIAYEARDLPQLWKLFQQREAFYRNLKLIIQNPAFIRMKFAGGGPREFVSKLIREGILSTHYGINPTFGDISSIIREVKLARKGLNGQPRGFSLSIRSSSGSMNRYFDAGCEYPWEPPVSYRKGSGVEEHKRFRVDGVRVSIVKDDLSRLASPWLQETQDAVSRYAGNNPLGLVWESAPASFMIDWLLNIDGVLDSLFLLRNNQIRCDYWSSEKTTIRQEIILDTCEDIQGPFPGLIKTWKAQDPVVRSATRYWRGKREQPSPLDSIQTSDKSLGVKLFWACLIGIGIAGPR